MDKRQGERSEKNGQRAPGDQRPNCRLTKQERYTMAKIPIELPEEKVSTFCQKWKIQELSLFGSVLRDDFGPESDIDILVTFQKDAKHTLFDLVHMEDELKEILGREIDVVSRRGIEFSRNHLRRNAILNSAEIVYGSRPRISA